MKTPSSARRRVVLVLGLLGAAAVALTTPAATSAAAPAGCPAADANSLAAGACLSDGAIVPSLDPAWSDAFVPPPLPKARSVLACRPLAAVFYAPSDWVRLAQKLRGNPSACADYYVSIPPLAADKTKLRSGEAAKIRALGPQMHAMAEINVTGWTTWVSAGNGSWYDAGVEARRRMDAAGFDVAAGDIWAVNEFSSAVRTGTGNARPNMRDLVRGLYTGDGTVPTVQGLVWTAGIGQATGDLSTYKTNLKAWLQDAAFWADMNGRVRFWSQEVFGDARKWAVPGADLQTRRDPLVDYLEQVSVLSQVSPPALTDTAAYLRASDGPLANAAWAFQSGFGYTFVPVAQMKAYVASQTYALRSYQGRAAWRDGDSFGFAWSPTNSPPPFGLTQAQYVAQSADILDQIAASIHASDVPSDDPGIEACGVDASSCAADIDGAAFNPAWHTFWTWTQPSASDSAASVAEDTPTAIPLLASDPDGEPLAYAILAPPQHGTLSGDGASRTYTPAPDFNGADAFTFQVSDGVMTSRVATVSIAVTAVNDPPVTTATISPTAPNGENGWFTVPVQVTLAAADVDSPGIASTEYAVDDGVFRPYTGPFTVTGDGAQTVLYRSTDTDGGVEDAKPLALKVDLTDPASSASASPAIRNGWYATPAVRLTGDDGSGSGIAQISYAVDGEPTWHLYTGPLTGFATGNHFVQLRAADAAGRVQPTVSLFAFRADSAAPSVNVTTPADGRQIRQDRVVTATFRCVDRESGIDTCDGTAANGAALDTSTAGDHAFTVTATDLAGNATTVTHHYEVVPPS